MAKQVLSVHLLERGGGWNAFWQNSIWTAHFPAGASLSNSFGSSVPFPGQETHRGRQRPNMLTAETLSRREPSVNYVVPTLPLSFPCSCLKEILSIILAIFSWTFAELLLDRHLFPRYQPLTFPNWYRVSFSVSFLAFWSRSIRQVWLLSCWVRTSQVLMWISSVIQDQDLSTQGRFKIWMEVLAEFLKPRPSMISLLSLIMNILAEKGSHKI